MNHYSNPLIVLVTLGVFDTFSSARGDILDMLEIGFASIWYLLWMVHDRRLIYDTATNKKGYSRLSAVVDPEFDL